MSLAETLDRIVRRQQEVSALLSGEAASDAGQFQKLSKEYAELEPVVEAINAYRATESEIADLDELLADPETDREMKAYR